MVKWNVEPMPGQPGFYAVYSDKSSEWVHKRDAPPSRDEIAEQKALAIGGGIKPSDPRIQQQVDEYLADAARLGYPHKKHLGVNP